MQHEPAPRASRLISEDPYEDGDEEAEPTVSEPFPIANDLVLLARANDTGTMDPDVSPFILELARASRAYVANVELRIVAAATLRQAKANRDLRSAEILVAGVKPTGNKASPLLLDIPPSIDGKTAEIREAQLAVLCSNDTDHVEQTQRAEKAECDLEAATLRADACRELSRSIRSIILALTAPLSATSGNTEESN